MVQKPETATGIAKGPAQLAGLVSPECGRRDSLAQEEGQCEIAQGGSFLQTAEAAGSRGLQGAAMRGLELLYAFVRAERLILQHARAPANMIAGARRQAGRAVQVRATRHVLHTEAQGRAQVAPTSHALHDMLLCFPTQRRVLIRAEALRRRMFSAAARRHLAQLLSIHEPPPQTAAEPAQLSEYAVPIGGAQRGFQPLRPRSFVRFIYDIEERDAAHVHRPGLTPSDDKYRQCWWVDGSYRRRCTPAQRMGHGWGAGQSTDLG